MKFNNRNFNPKSELNLKLPNDVISLAKIGQLQNIFSFTIHSPSSSKMVIIVLKMTLV